MILVRIATMQDADAIAHQTAEVQKLHADAMPRLFRPPNEGLFPREKLAALLADENSIVAVAEGEGKILGNVYAEIARRGETAFCHPETAVYLHQICVAERARRQGVGTALLGFIEKRAAQLGATSIGLDHWVFNTPAKRFFESRGFSPSNVRM